MKKNEYIAGVDEVGRGSLAGPVTAGCVYIPSTIKHIPPYIRDSKTLTEAGRIKAYQWVSANCLFAVGSVSAKYVDAHGIKMATKQAMKKAIVNLQKQVPLTALLVDGNDKFTLPVPATYYCKGDTLYPCISAASIVAKVTRDTYMQAQSKRYVNYQFDTHKGYGTKAHFLAIQTHGMCVLHRRSFLKSFNEKQ